MLREVPAREITIGNATFTIWCESRSYNPELEVYRPVYSYSIVTDEWEYNASDIQGAENEIPNLGLASAALLALLLSCVQATDDMDDAEMFPYNVRQLGRTIEKELIEVCASITGE